MNKYDENNSMEVKKNKVHGKKDQRLYVLSIVVAVLAIMVGIVWFVQYLLNEVVQGHITMSQSIIIFLAESVAVVLISKALKRFAENRSKELEVHEL